MIRIWALALAALAAAGAGARAELVLESAGWQASRAGAPKGARWQDAVSPAEAGVLLRGRVALKNRGPQAAQTILLRYALSARLARAEPGDEGTWAVPFLVDESRVGTIPPNQVMIVPLNASPMLELYRKRLERHGLRARELRLQVMLEPRSSDPGERIQVLESVLELKP